jgi:hypothetical protein
MEAKTEKPKIELRDFYISKDLYFPECFYISFRQIDSLYERIYAKNIKGFNKFIYITEQLKSTDILQIEFKDFGELVSYGFAQYIADKMAGNPDPLNNKK